MYWIQHGLCDTILLRNLIGNDRRIGAVGKLVPRYQSTWTLLGYVAQEH